ncbi:gamma-glutamyltranspeptidase-like protein [Lojkania enalia]|uniref:Glutathione hydrolase n=1 Tax=Lojkania enalia TaxID=147567 RepID=A0A9P4N8T1_9PLEO|nr:gamma-glutamyltranspeptidase-like protein [Didymosphaeria enalia]
MISFFSSFLSNLPSFPSITTMVPRTLHYITGLLTVQTVLSNPVPPCPSGKPAPPALGPGQLGAVASESDICSHVGTDLLKKGGNAADAMVGTVFCVGVVGNYHSGVGGGGFMVVRSPNGTYEFIDFRETAPAAGFEEMYQGNIEGSLTSGLASGVPGEVRGLQYLHENYGVLPWAAVLEPAINISRYGWTVNEDLVRYMESATGDENFLVNDLEFAMDFAPKGHLLKLGETITRKRYANTLETIANEGPDAFYEGPIAETMIKALQAQNGTMTLDDLKNYTVEIRRPSTITYRDYKLTACSAPSGGVIALSILKIMEQYEDIGNPAATNLTTHRLDEAMKWAYAARTAIGDPLFVDDYDVNKLQARIVSPAWAHEIVRQKINDTTTFNSTYYNPSGLEVLNTPGTSHIATADHTGLSISLTTTINLLWGSKLVVPETGIIMNNEMNDFSIPGSSNAFGYRPSPANYIRPGKRPLSSMSPVIIEHLNSSAPASAFYVAIGAAGGSRIITSTVQNVINLLDRNMSMYNALNASRMHDQLFPEQTTFEYEYDNSTVLYMKELGHNVQWVAPGSSAAQGLRKFRDGAFEAAGEPRQKNSGGFVV